MSLVKYRLKEVAADFGVAPKEIAEIILREPPGVRPAKASFLQVEATCGPGLILF